MSIAFGILLAVAMGFTFCFGVVFGEWKPFLIVGGIILVFVLITQELTS